MNKRKNGLTAAAEIASVLAFITALVFGINAWQSNEPYSAKVDTHSVKVTTDDSPPFKSNAIENADRNVGVEEITVKKTAANPQKPNVHVNKRVNENAEPLLLEFLKYARKDKTKGAQTSAWSHFVKAYEALSPEIQRNNKATLMKAKRLWEEENSFQSAIDTLDNFFISLNI